MFKYARKVSSANRPAVKKQEVYTFWTGDRTHRTETSTETMFVNTNRMRKFSGYVLLNDVTQVNATSMPRAESELNERIRLVLGEEQCEQ